MLSLLKKPCSQCPWTGALQLAPGGLKAHADTCRDQDRHFVCHKYLDGGTRAPKDAPVCRGFYDALPGVGQLVRIAQRLGVLQEIDGPDAGSSPTGTRWLRVRRTKTAHAFRDGAARPLCGRVEAQPHQLLPVTPTTTRCTWCRRRLERSPADPAPTHGLSCSCCGSTLDAADPTLPSGRGACRSCRE